MSKHLIRFPLLFLLIAAPFYFMDLHAISQLNDFLAHAVHQSGLVLSRITQSPVPVQRRQRDITRYLLQVDQPDSQEPTRIWATGDTRLAIGDMVTFYYHPNNPDDARVIDGKEISRYRKEFFFNSLLLTFFVFSTWLFIEKEILENETVPSKIG